MAYTPYPFDGADAVPNHQDYGAVGSAFEYIAGGAEFDDNSTMTTGSKRPSPRLITTTLFTTPFKYNTIVDMNSMFPYFAQWIAHDLAYAPGDTGAPFPIPVPTCDSVLDRGCVGNATIPFTRQGGDVGPNGYPIGRNGATSWLDCSTVYGTSKARADALRTFSDGLLKTSKGPFGPLLPFNLNGLSNVGGDNRQDLFLAGDPRANENLPLLILHTIFHLEHNRFAVKLKMENPRWTDEELYQGARRLVIAVNQKMVYHEYIPKLLQHGLPTYVDYIPNTNPAVDVAFLNAAMEFVVSATNENHYIANENRRPIGNGVISVAGSHLDPTEIRLNGMDRLIRGLLLQPQASTDLNVDPSLLNSPNAPYDVVSNIIQRGRDLGIPTLNKVRAALGLLEIHDFAELSFNPTTVNNLQLLYQNVSDVDVFVAGLAEDSLLPAYNLAATFDALVTAQMTRTRAADPRYYLRPGMFSEAEKTMIEKRTLSRMMLDSTSINYMPKDAFALQTALGFDASSNAALVDPAFGSVQNVTTTSKNPIFSPLPGYEMRWTINGTMWNVELSTEKGGWIGVGFGGYMAGADVILCFYYQGFPLCSDSTVATDFQSTPKPDFMLMRSMDIDQGTVSGNIRDGKLIMKFSRKLDTGDPGDTIITNSMMPMIFAHGTTTMPSQHGVLGRALGRVNLFTQTTVVDAEDAFYLDSTSSIAIITIASILICAQIMMMAVVAVKRNIREIKLASPILLSSFSVGTMLFSVFTILSALRQDAAICAGRLASIMAGASLIFVTIAGKLFRYYKIFSNRTATLIVIKNEHIATTALTAATLDVAIVGMMCTMYPFHPLPEDPNSCPTTPFSQYMFPVLLASKFFMLVVALVLVRKCSDFQGKTFLEFKPDIDAEGHAATMFTVILSTFLVVIGLMRNSYLPKHVMLQECIMGAMLACCPGAVYAYNKYKTFQAKAQQLTTHMPISYLAPSKKPFKSEGPKAFAGSSKKMGASLPVSSTEEVKSMEPTNLVEEAREKLATLMTAHAATLLEWNTQQNIVVKVSDRLEEFKLAILRLQDDLEFLESLCPEPQRPAHKI